MNNRPSFRDLFPEMFSVPATRTVSTDVPTLTPLKDEEYRERIAKAGWQGGIPDEFIDPVFKNIIKTERFEQWLSLVELKLPRSDIARMFPSAGQVVKVCYLQGEPEVESLKQAQPVAVTAPVAIPNTEPSTATKSSTNVGADSNEDFALLNRSITCRTANVTRFCSHSANSCTCTPSSSQYSFTSSRGSFFSGSAEDYSDFSVDESDFEKLNIKNLSTG